MKPISLPGKNDEIEEQVKVLQKEKYFQELFRFHDTSLIAFYACDIAGRILYYNPAASRLWGASPESGKIYCCRSWKAFHLDGQPLKAEECPTTRAIEEKKPSANQEIYIERPDGSIKNILAFSQPIVFENGKIIGACCTLVDITEQQSSQLKQANLSAIVESSDDAIISKDLNGIIKSWNAGAQRIFGYSEEEVLGRPVTILIPQERLEEEEQILKKIRKGRSVDHFETVRKTKSGKEIKISLTVSPIKDSKGRVMGASKIARDITSQVQAQEEIKKYNENLEILNSIGKSISENLDVQAVLQRVTDATTKLTGAQFGAFFYNHINEDGRAMMLYNLSGAPREAFEKFGMPRHTDVFRPTFTGEGPIRVDDITKDPRYGNNAPHSGMPHGHLPVVSYLAVPVISKSGLIIGGLLFGHRESGIFTAEHEEMVVNIAAQAAISLDNSKLFEQVKSLSDKKDEFIALASHELKTPLTTIKGYLQVLEKKEKDQMTTLFIDKALNQVNKLNTLIEDLLNMSRIEAGKLDFNLEEFDIREMLLEIIETFGYSYDSHEIKFDLGEGPAKVHGDRQRIEQAIINLVTNAIKYSPEADKIYIRLKVEKDRVRIKVRDEGIGLSEEQRSQLFTRFYRAENTKGISGLGIGLYLTKQIIDRHNGEIGVTSKLGEGSEFNFYLPLINK